MANRNDSNPYMRNRSKQDGNDRGYSSHSRRRRFKLNGINIALIAVIIIGSIIGISLAVKGSPNADGKSTNTALQATDTPIASDSGSQLTDSPSPSAISDTAATVPAVAAATGSTSSGLFTSGDVQVDDAAMTYKSADLNVKITNVNENGVNYYIADCQQNGNKIFTALATDKYSSGKAEPSSDMARRKGAVIAINGDYYGSTDSVRKGRGIVIRNGTLYRSTPYNDVAVVYGNGTMKTLAKSDAVADQLVSDGAIQAFCFGPRLLDESGKAFTTQELKSRGEPLVNPANPRSGIGYIEPNHFVLIVVDGRDAGGSKGMSSAEFAKLFESLGCKSAYNFDGGGSATMVFMGKVINHPCDAGGERSVSDIVYFAESETDQANIDRFNSQ
jgi:exopolysaccharide biosynthesis protein